MTNSIRSDFHTDLAKMVLDDIQYRRANYYYFLGKSEPWGTNDVSPVDTQIDSSYENSLIRSNALYVKKITANDVSLVTKRYNWTTGTVYDKWDHTKVMNDKAFYVVTDEDRVYKCLDNFGGVESTEQPTGTSFYPIRTADGYLWKFMYSIPTFKRYRFASFANIPVQTSLTDSFYNKGSVDSVVIENGGSGYSDVALTTITVNGTTTGAGAEATIITNGVGTIIGVTLVDGGADYTEGVNIVITSATGTNADIRAVITAGVVTGITIEDGGVGYDESDVVSFVVGGAQVVPKVSRATGSIEGVTILNPGIGYLPGMTLTINSLSGTGAYGNPDAILTPIVYQGSLQRVLIEDPGVGYPVDTATTIVVQGDGVDASFTPVIQDGTIVDVIVDNPGTGYTSIVLTVVGAGVGAKLTGIVTASDFQSDQSIVEQTTEPGKIYAIEVSDPGELYSATTIVTVTGDGTGCTAEAIVENGTVVAIKVTDFGQGYTYANVVITDPNRNYFADDKTARAYAIFPPTGGHGKDAVGELYGSTLAISMSLRNDATINSLSQDYRQYGLMKNPSVITSGQFFYGTSSLIAHTVRFTDTTDLVKDEVLLLGTVKYRVIDVDANVVTLQQLGIASIDPVGQFVAQNENTRTYLGEEVLTYPVVNKYSGKLLYASNENPFSFTEEQGIIIKTFLSF